MRLIALERVPPAVAHKKVWNRIVHTNGSSKTYEFAIVSVSLAVSVASVCLPVVSLYLWPRALAFNKNDNNKNFRQ